MTQTTLDQAATGLLVNLVTFQWLEGFTPATDQEVRGYVAGSSTLDVGAQRFIAIPPLDIRFGKQDGGTGDVPVILKMPPLRPFDNLIRDDGVHAPILCTIEQFDPSGDATSGTVLYQGEVDKVKENPGGNADVLEITLVGPKRRLLAALGIPILRFCPWAFGDKSCCVDLIPIRETGTVTTVSGFDVTVSGLTTTAISRYWHRGSINVRGAELFIREYTTGSTFTLQVAPPPSWVGEAARLTPGCDKTLGTCITRWDKEENFGGSGIKMPGYHPVFAQG